MEVWRALRVREERGSLDRSRAVLWLGEGALHAPARCITRMHMGHASDGLTAALGPLALAFVVAEVQEPSLF